jgi:hypothetical protein
VVAGVVIPVALVIVYLGYNNFMQKPAPITPQITVTPKVNFDGTYTGNTGVAGGLADVSLTVTGNQLTGDATYKGIVDGRTITVPAKITGTVTSAGVVAGTVAVSGVQFNQNISITGPTNGQIADNIMMCNYQISGDVGEYKGQISLLKK